MANIHSKAKYSLNDSGEIVNITDGKVLTGNSTTTILGAGASFTGTAFEVLDYGIIFVNVYSDQASATDGLKIEQSSDGTNWDHCDEFTITAATGKNFSINPFAQYVRVVFTNGATPQTEFRLQTIAKNNSKPSSHRIQDSIIDDDDAELVKAVLTGKANGSFKNVLTTVDGNLTISDNSNGLSIARGNVTGAIFIHKFGEAPDFDQTDGLITVWDGAEDNVTWENMVYDYSSTADIDSLSSSDNGDTQDIEVQGLDVNYEVVTQTITLTGQTRAPLATNLIRVFRMKNVGSSVLAGHVFCYVDVALSSGVPTVAANIRAIIQPGNNQTLMAVYTIPAGKTGYMRDWYSSTSGANKSSNYQIKLLARPFGGVFQVKHVSAISDSGSSNIQHVYTEPEIFAEKTDIEIQVAMQAAGGTAARIAAGFDLVLIDT